MKLFAVRVKGNVVRYMLNINKSEAESAGFVDADGNSVEVEKVVDAENGLITIKKADGEVRKAITSKFVYDNLEVLLSGGRARTARNVHYTMKDNVLYRQGHQPYLRGEEPLPYAVYDNGVFYEILDD